MVWLLRVTAVFVLALAPPARAQEVQVGAREEYRLRSSAAPDQSSHDVRLGLDLGIQDSKGQLTAATQLALFWTPLRSVAEGTTDGLATVLDVRKPFFDVYQLSADYRGAGLLRLVRAGRQASEHGRPATFDGASVLLRPTPAFTVFAFGGRSVHFFEVPQAGFLTFDDWLASAGVGLKPLSWLRFEVDYRLLLERVGDESGELRPVTNHSYGASAWLRPSDAVWARLTVRGLDNLLAEASLSGHVFFTAPALSLDGRFFLQPVTLGLLNELDNPFYLTLGPSLPHARWRLDASRNFALPRGAVEVHLGWAGRALLKDPETAFNRTSNRLYLSGGVRDVGLPGLSAQLSLERLTNTAAPFVGKGIFTLNAAAAYERALVRGEVGVQYYQYQYTYFRDVEEVADVRVVFAELRVKPLSWLSVRARYQLELFDRTRHTFTFSLAQVY